MLFSCSAQTKIWHKAANNLHRAMWRTDLEKRLVEVDECEDLKYLPPTEVRNLQLKALGCNANAILIREEYVLTLKELEKHRPNIGGGIVLTGQPGIGTSLLQDMGRPAHVFITRREIYFSVLSVTPSP
jgi:hypothetical protein